MSENILKLKITRWARDIFKRKKVFDGDGNTLIPIDSEDLLELMLLVEEKEPRAAVTAQGSSTLKES